LTGSALYAAESFILRFSQQPGIFDLSGWASAAKNIDNFARRVCLAIDVGLIGVGGGVTCYDYIRKGKNPMVRRQRFRFRNVKGGSGQFSGHQCFVQALSVNQTAARAIDQVSGFSWL
jgi:hypothetical protein